MRIRRHHHEFHGKPPTGRDTVPVDDHQEVWNALDTLPPAARRLLAERLLSNRSLAELARERETSVATLWRRLQAGKHVLQRLLARCWSLTWLGAGGPRQPTRPSSVASRIGPGSTIGGIAMAGKSISGAIAILMVAMTFGVGIGFMIGRTRGYEKFLNTRISNKTSIGDARERLREEHMVASTIALLAKKESDGTVASENSPLAEKLRRFRGIVLAAHGSGPDHALECYGQLTKETEALRKDVLANPDEYLVAIRSPEYEEVLCELLNIAFNRRQWNVTTEGYVLDSPHQAAPSDAVPDAIVEAMYELLGQGTPRQKEAVLSNLDTRDGQGKPNRRVMDECIALLSSEKNPGVLYGALADIQNAAPDLLLNRIDLLARLVDTARAAEIQRDPNDEGKTFFLFHQMCLNSRIRGNGPCGPTSREHTSRRTPESGRSVNYRPFVRRSEIFSGSRESGTDGIAPVSILPKYCGSRTLRQPPQSHSDAPFGECRHGTGSRPSARPHSRTPLGNLGGTRTNSEWGPQSASPPASPHRVKGGLVLEAPPAPPAPAAAAPPPGARARGQAGGAARAIPISNEPEWCLAR
jgi:hypothetical protein